MAEYISAPKVPVNRAYGPTESAPFPTAEGTQQRKQTADSAKQSGQPVVPKTAVDLRFYDFHRIKDHSFLPDILSVAEQNRIPIVFVRMPRRVTKARRADLPQEVALRSYVADLGAYLEQRGYPFVDLASFADLGPDDFEVGDHLSPSGRDLFTPVLHAALAPHLPAQAFVDTN